MPMKTIMKIICLCVWEMWHTSSFCSFCVGVFVLSFVEVSVERGELPGERWIKCFSFSFFSHVFFYYWKAVKRSHRSSEMRAGRGTPSSAWTQCSVSLSLSLTLRKTQKSNVPCENELSHLVWFLCVCVTRWSVCFKASHILLESSSAGPL